MIAKRSVSRRTVAWLCALLLVLSILPLYALSLYNHAFYDDFGFSLLTRDAWQNTGNLFAVLEAGVRNTVGIRNTWEGTYATSFISTFQPSIVGEGAYWVTTFFLLTAFLLAVWYFLKQSMRSVYGMDRTTVITAFSVLGFILVQFAPDAAEAFFWFNGGVAYTLLWSVMLFEAGVWLKFEQATGKVRCTLLYLLLIVLTVLVGGAKYSTTLLAVLLALCFTGWAFYQKRPKRWAYAGLTVLLLACFAFSMAAAGNTVRAATLSGGMSAPKAILQAVYFGIALIGNSFSLPLLAALILLVPLCTPALKQCGFKFAHPVWVTILCVGLFCAQLAPTLYTGNYLGDGRVLNTYHYTFVLMVAQLALYWTGYFLRRSEKGLAPLVSAQLLSDNMAVTNIAEKPVAKPVPAHQRLKAVTLAIVAGMLLVGSVAYHPEGTTNYGLMNLAGGSALRSILNGEAAAYDAEMDKRDAIMNDPTLQDVALTPVTTVPASFMGDALDSEHIDYVLSLYADYYNKTTVQIAELED